MSNPLERPVRTLCMLLCVLLGVALASLGLPTDARAAEESRAVTGFEAVALEMSGDVKVTLAERASVRVIGTADALASTQTVVEDREGVPTLVIRSARSGWSVFPSKVQVLVQGPRFRVLSVAGSGNLEATLGNQPALRLAVAGAGDLRVRGVTTHRAEVSVAGSGDVRVQGAAQNLSVRVAGSGDAWLREFEAEDVRVNVAGSGDARVHARQRLQASVAGSGDIRHTGPARDVSVSVVGSGRVVRD